MPVAVQAIDAAKLGVANAHRLLQHGRKHWLKIARRTADDLKHLRRRRLLLQRFGVRSVVRWRSSLSNRAFSMAMTAWAAKFVHQRDLFVGEGTDFLAVQAENTD